MVLWLLRTNTKWGTKEPPPTRSSDEDGGLFQESREIHLSLCASLPPMLSQKCLSERQETIPDTHYMYLHE